MFNRRLRPIVIAMTVGVSAACGGGDSDSTGHVTVSITDAPVDVAQEIWVKVTGVAFKPSGSGPEIVENFSPRTLNLLQYQQGDVAVLLDDVLFTAGSYQWLRLIIESEPNVRDSYVMVNGSECELRVPSGAESGLKMNRGFSIPADGSLALTIDFDLRQSLHAPPGQSSGTSGACTQGYLLRPTLRLIEDANVGAISGTVSFESGTPPESCMPKVYLFSDTVVPDDLEETSASPDVDPLVVVGVSMPDGAVSGTYRAAFIPAGSYTAAFTCDDDTDADESLDFSPVSGAPVTVQNNLISTLNFVVPAES
jgi:Domain of unknown function (DUF4382)